MQNIEPMPQNAIPADFESVKERAMLFYSSLKDIWCPYLQQNVAFNAKGKEHLKFKEKHKARVVHDQYIRFKLLKFAPLVVKDSRTLQGINESKIFELNRSNHRNEYILVDVIYFEFIAVLERKVRIKIIVKQVNSSNPYFWSIIPFWKQTKMGDRKKMYEGNPESD